MYVHPNALPLVEKKYQNRFRACILFIENLSQGNKCKIEYSQK